MVTSGRAGQDEAEAIKDARAIIEEAIAARMIDGREIPEQKAGVGTEELSAIPLKGSRPGTSMAALAGFYPALILNEGMLEASTRRSACHYHHARRLRQW